MLCLLSGLPSVGLHPRKPHWRKNGRFVALGRGNIHLMLGHNASLFVGEAKRRRARKLGAKTLLFGHLRVVKNCRR